MAVAVFAVKSGGGGRDIAAMANGSAIDDGFLAWMLVISSDKANTRPKENRFFLGAREKRQDSPRGYVRRV